MYPILSMLYRNSNLNRKIGKKKYKYKLGNILSLMARLKVTDYPCRMDISWSPVSSRLNQYVGYSLACNPDSLGSKTWPIHGMQCM